MKIRILQILIMALLLLSTSVVCAEERVALVIGNGAYRHTNALENPGNDARGVAAVLRGLNFDLDLQIDADYQTMRSAVRRFATRLRGSGVGLFYYAGHGLQINGQNYLAPVDARLLDEADLQFEAVSLDLVMTQLEREPRVSLVFLDACRDNPLARNLARSMGSARSASVGRGLSRVSAGIGTLIAYATQPGNIAADGAGRNSPFTAALLQHIETPGLEVRQVLTRVRNSVIETTGRRQVPWDHSSLTGDFYFVAGGSVVLEDEPTGAPNTGGLHVETRPEGAEVWIDDKRMGRSPITLDGLNPGRVMVKATKPNYGDTEVRVRIRTGRRTPITLLLDREVTTGSISILSAPDAAVWYLDGDYMGRTPDKAQGIESGSHEIEVRKPGYRPWFRSIDIEKGGSIKLDARLEADKFEYALAVATEPAGARVRILNIGPRYYSGIRLKPGRYHLEISNPGYETHYEWIELADADRVVEVSLRQRTASSTSVRSRREWTDPVTGMAFAWVPRGCFQMGSSKGRSDEKPAHEACVDGFWLGKYEVTQGQWKKLMRNNPSYFKLGDNHPVESVSWVEAQKFIGMLNARGQGGFRLPTEAEWEYACRSGGKQEKYCGGNDVSRVAWYKDNSGGTTQAVGKKLANGLGLHDMSGNVWEWVANWYGRDYYSKSPKNNPKGPSTGDSRVDRGGSWSNGPAFVRAVYRSRFEPDSHYYDLGFRLARTSP